jgi:hypothetical protein
VDASGLVVRARMSMTGAPSSSMFRCVTRPSLSDQRPVSVKLRPPISPQHRILVGKHRTHVVQACELLSLSSLAARQDGRCRSTSFCRRRRRAKREGRGMPRLRA